MDLKTFKIFDVLAQLLIIVVFLVGSFWANQQWMLTGYFVVGSWQVLSMLIHQINKWHLQKGSRRWYYHIIATTILIIIITAIIIPSLFMVWFIMLVAAPIMALFYAFICYREVFHPVKRPLHFI